MKQISQILYHTVGLDYYLRYSTLLFVIKFIYVYEQNIYYIIRYNYHSILKFIIYYFNNLCARANK